MERQTAVICALSAPSGAAVGTGTGSEGCETSLFSHMCLILFGDDGAREKTILYTSRQTPGGLKLPSAALVVLNTVVLWA